jgi:hypothetical protein
MLFHVGGLHVAAKVAAINSASLGGLLRLRLPLPDDRQGGGSLGRDIPSQIRKAKSARPISAADKKNKNKQTHK